MSVIDDVNQSPIWSRLFSDIKSGNINELLGIIGHLPFVNVFCQIISINSKPKVISHDVLTSWMYRFDQKCLYLQARLTYWDPNTNQLIHLRLS